MGGTMSAQVATEDLPTGGVPSIRFIPVAVIGAWVMEGRPGVIPGEAIPGAILVVATVAIAAGVTAAGATAEDIQEVTEVTNLPSFPLDPMIPARLPNSDH